MTREPVGPLVIPSRDTATMVDTTKTPHLKEDDVWKQPMKTTTTNQKYLERRRAMKIGFFHIIISLQSSSTSRVVTGSISSQSPIFLPLRSKSPLVLHHYARTSPHCAFNFGRPGLDRHDEHECLHPQIYLHDFWHSQNRNILFAEYDC
jgi:hypothetical protein